MNAKPIKIAVEDANGKYRSLTKIVPYPDGGFAVLAPYHNAKEGFLFRIAVPEEKTGTFSVPWPDELDRYSASDRVKLSFHPDGFVQFSGENSIKILSGRDADGKPKGLGIVRAPLSQPIISGPTLSIVVWGLSDFEECSGSARNIIRFSRQDLYYRAGSPTVTTSGVVIDGIVLPSALWACVRGAGLDLRVRMVFGRLARGFASFDVRVVPLENPDVFLGLFANHTSIGFDSPSGFELCSPGDEEHYRLLAFYPKSAINLPVGRSLDFKPIDQRGMEHP